MGTFLQTMRRAGIAAAVAGLLVSGVAALPAEAAARTVTVTVSDSRCSGGGSVKAIQLGAVPAVTSVPYTSSNSAKLKVLTGGRSITFTGTVWCSRPWWMRWGPKLRPNYVVATVYVPANASKVSL